MSAKRGEESTSTGREEAVERFLQLRPQFLARTELLPPPSRDAQLSCVTPHQLVALTHLPVGGLTMHDMAVKLGVSAATASLLADRLVHKGLAERGADPNDRRVVLLLTTELGRELADRYRQAQRLAVCGLLDKLSEAQVAAWLDIMETLLAEDSEDSKDTSKSEETTSTEESPRKPPSHSGEPLSEAQMAGAAR